MLESGYIKLYRSLLSWEWYDDINTKTVFLHLLLTVSIEESKWHGITVPRGARVSSYQALAKETGLSVQQLRTSVKRLESTGTLTRYKYPKYTVFALKNFDKYQPSTSKETSCQQGTNKVPTGSQQQYKKIEEDKEDYNLSFLDAAREKNAPPTFEEIQKYPKENVIETDLKRFYSYYEQHQCKTKNGDDITDWTATLRYWEKRDGKFKKKKKQQQETPVSENAEAYASLILNLDEPI